MNISEACIRRPVMTTLVTASFVAFGLAAYFQLPVADLPTVDFPTIQVSASLPGANPETMAATVATPLERRFSTIAGLTSMPRASIPRRSASRRRRPVPEPISRTGPPAPAMRSR